MTETARQADPESGGFRKNFRKRMISSGLLDPTIPPHIRQGLAFSLLFVFGLIALACIEIVLLALD